MPLNRGEKERLLKFNDNRYSKRALSGSSPVVLTSGYVPVADSTGSLVDSVMRQSGSNIGIGASPVDSHLYVYDNAVNTTDDYYGIYNQHNKTAGITDASDDMYGVYNQFRFNQAGGVIGSLYGNWTRAVFNAGTISVNAYGGRSEFQQDGGTVSGSVLVFNGVADLNAGTVDFDVFGASLTIAQAVGNTISGDAYVCRISGDFDGTVTGTSYMMYLKENTGVDYGIYQDGSADNYLQGDTGVGITSPANALHVYRNDASDPTTANGSLLIVEQDGAGDAGIQLECTGGPLYSIYTTANFNNRFVINDINNFTDVMVYDPTQKEVIFNENSKQIDFRVESDGEDKLFVVDATANAVLVGDFDTNYVQTTSTGLQTYVGTGGVPYGSMYQDDIPTTITIVTKDVDVIVDGMTTGALLGTTFQNAKELKIATAGHYKVDWSMSFSKTGGAAQEIEGAVGIGGVRQANTGAHRLVSASNDTGNIAGTGIIDCAVDDLIQIVVRNETGTQDVVVGHASLSLMMVGGT